MARKLRQNLPTSVADHKNVHSATRDSFCYELENRAVTVPRVSRSLWWDAEIDQTDRLKYLQGQMENFELDYVIGDDF